MTKAKFLVLLFLFVILMLVLPTVVNATTVEYTRTIPSNDGTIKLNFTGLELDVAKSYEFSLVRQGGTPESWFSIDDGYMQNSASITLSSATSAITNVLKATDTGFIYIREKDNTTESYILEAYQVDLKLPYLKSLIYTKTNSEYDLTTARLYGVIGNNYIYSGGNQTYIYWEKVTDEELIANYLNIKNNNGTITSLESSLPNPPESEYMAHRNPNYTNKNDGLYLLWVYRTAENCKTVYSCIVHDGLPNATEVEHYIQSTDVDAPKMETLEIEWSTAMDYDSATGYRFVSPGTTITIKATFNEIIYGNTAPTLTIKCGNGEEKEVSGTITGQYIVYNYTIAEEDVGIIAAIKMTGGDVADEDGNAVINYECPTLEDSIWGEFVYANGSGIAVNPDDESDSNNGNKEENAVTNNSEKNETTKEDNTIKKDDTTIATGKLPNTGLKIGLVLLLVIAVIGIIAYLKSNKLKEI